jgi:hypothetical protein
MLLRLAWRKQRTVTRSAVPTALTAYIASLTA